VDDFKTKHVILQDPKKGEDLTPAGVLLVTPDLAGARTGTPRPGEEIEKLDVVDAGSLDEVCRKLDVRVRGNITDADGADVAVNIPVRNEKVFTPDGLTRKDPTLRRLYLTSRVAESASKFFDKTGGITDEQVAALESLVETLKRSLPSDEETDL
jgi:predicted component of type VI protein secretion system